jgi:uncharacterized DUF497 family protein
MIDFERIAGFGWDAGNARKNEQHGITQPEAEQVFFDAHLLIVQDERHSSAEPRFHALGKTVEGRLLHVTFTLRGENTLLRVISARDMQRKERNIYGQET